MSESRLPAAVDLNLANTLIQAASMLSARVEPMDFQGLCERYLSEYASISNASSTYDRQVYTVRSVILPWFGPDTPVSEIGTERCQAFVADRMAQGCSAATAKKSLDQLKVIFARAMDWGYAVSNPAAGIRPPKTDLVEMDFLSPDEVVRLLDAAPSAWRASLYVLTLCGLRGGEFLGLKWGDVDVEAHCLHVRRAWSNGRYVVPKTRSSVRSVPLPPSVERELGVLRGQQGAGRGEVVFANRAGKPIDWNNYRKRVFLPTLERAGLRRIRLHDLRHTYASLLIAQGENLKFVQACLGHSSIKTTADRYGHLVNDSMSPAGTRLDELVFGSRG